MINSFNPLKQHQYEHNHQNCFRKAIYSNPPLRQEKQNLQHHHRRKRSLFRHTLRTQTFRNRKVPQRLHQDQPSHQSSAAGAFGSCCIGQLFCIVTK